MKMIRNILVITLGFFVFSPSPVSAQVSVGISITARIAPPPLVIYEQPPCPYDGYLWMPGYWAYGDEGYFWVPGVWVMAPEVGFLWTPGYWGWGGNAYAWNGEI